MSLDVPANALTTPFSLSVLTVTSGAASKRLIAGADNRPIKDAGSLAIAAGLLEPSSGSVSVFGQTLQASQGVNKRAGYMFQADALMPWRTGLDNVVAGLEFRGIARSEAARSRETTLTPWIWPPGSPPTSSSRSTTLSPSWPARIRPPQNSSSCVTSRA